MAIVDTPLAPADPESVLRSPPPLPPPTVVTRPSTDTPGTCLWAFWRTCRAINLAALHPDPGTRALCSIPLGRVPGHIAWKTAGYPVAREVAVVATPLILPDGPYDQEIKSLLLYPLRVPPAGIEPTTDGLTVRRSTAEAQSGRDSNLRPPGCSWVRLPLSPPNESAIGRLGRTPPFHGGNPERRGAARSDGRSQSARGFESHPLRRNWLPPTPGVTGRYSIERDL
jgi:hypothetical protein